MPIAATPAGPLYFAHVPKCAGSSVERLLEDRFGPLALRDGRPQTLPEPARWARSSPQHMPAEALARLFPPGFFVASFALVRHPVRRLRSVFTFQQENERAIPEGMSFEAWTATLPDLLSDAPFALDRHIRPMHETVPEDAVIFPLEGGLAPVVAWIDRMTGTQGPPQEGLPVLKSWLARRRRLGQDTTPPEITDTARTRIETLYAEDYARFGYATGATGLKDTPDVIDPRAQAPGPRDPGT